MLALGLRRGNWSPACPGTSSGPWASWFLWTLPSYSSLNFSRKIGMVVQQGSCKGVLSVLETEWICLFWWIVQGDFLTPLLQELPALCTHPAASTPWKAAPMHAEHCSPCILWANSDQPSNEWVLKSMPATFLKVHLTFLIVDACAGGVSLFLSCLPNIYYLYNCPKNLQPIGLFLCNIPMGRFLSCHVLSWALCPSWTESKSAKTVGSVSKCEAQRGWLYKNRSCGVFCWRQRITAPQILVVLMA